MVHISQLHSPILQVSKPRSRELIQVTLPSLPSPVSLHSISTYPFILFSHNCLGGPSNDSDSLCYAEWRIKSGEVKGRVYLFSKTPLFSTTELGLGLGLVLSGGLCRTSCSLSPGVCRVPACVLFCNATNHPGGQGFPEEMRLGPAVTEDGGEAGRGQMRGRACEESQGAGRA